MTKEKKRQNTQKELVDDFRGKVKKAF